MQTLPACLPRPCQPASRASLPSPRARSSPGGWWAAEVTAYNAATGEHQLTYNAGQEDESFEWVDLGEISNEDLRCVLVGRMRGYEDEARWGARRCFPGRHVVAGH